MKQFILLAVLTVIGVSGLNAQVVIKPSAGVNFTDFSKDQSTGEFTAKPGYQVGGSIAFGKKVYIEPGFFYMRQSTKFTSTSQGTDNIDYNISGIRIPLTVGAHLIGNEKSLISLRGFAGGSAFIMTRVEDLDKKDFNNASWSAFAGLGLDLSIIFFEAKYDWSLSNLKKDVTQIDVGKSRTIFLNAGFRIPL